MRLLAVAACLFATGCATSLGVVAPGVVSWEHRSGPEPTPASTVETVELDVARAALSLRLEAGLAEQRTYQGEMRRVEQSLHWVIGYSWFAEHAEHYIGIFMLPVVGPILLWHLAWWIYGRGLGPDERAVRPPPWGSELRDAFWWAVWPGHNAEALWRWRAELLPLEEPELGPWRERTRRQRVPLPGRAVELQTPAGPVTLPATGADGRSAVALTPPAAAEGSWRLGTQAVTVTAETPLTISARATGAAADAPAVTTELTAGYLADAAAARALRARQAREGRSAELHQALAKLYQRHGGYLQARCEWRRVARVGDAEQRDLAARRITALWRAEQRAARHAGDDRLALFCESAGAMEQALRAGTVDLAPLDGGDAVVAARLRDGSIGTVARTALALAAGPRTPSKPVTLALVQAAADHRRPAAAWAACAALIRHPSADATRVLPVVLRPAAPAALRRAAAQAVLVGSPRRGLQFCVRAASDPAVQWVLADATGAGLDPAVQDWDQWWRAQARTLEWRAAKWMFRTPFAPARATHRINSASPPTVRTGGPMAKLNTVLSVLATSAAVLLGGLAAPAVAQDAGTKKQDGPKPEPAPKPAPTQDDGKKDDAKKDDAKKDDAKKDDAKKDDGKKDDGPKKAPPKDQVITVYLKNGNTIRGYALNGVLYEREVRVTAATRGTRGFKRQEAYEPVKNAKSPNAGIRIWYPNNVKGFQFLRYNQIEKVQVGRTLTLREQQRLFSAIRAKEEKMAQARAKLREAARAQADAEADMRRAQIEKSIAASKGVSVEDDRKKREALLGKFPPSDGPNGWNAARKAAIERKLTVLGVMPSAQEAEFVKAFSEWNTAVSEAKKIGITPAAKKTETQEGGEAGEGAKTTGTESETGTGSKKKKRTGTAKDADQSGNS